MYQRIISQMPPHEEYVEPFLGGGAVMRRKRPARRNLGIDLDGGVVHRAANLVRAGEWVLPGYRIDGGDVPAPVSFEFHQIDGIDWLDRVGRSLGPEAVVYCDPPYPMAVRGSQRRIYRCELSDDDHRRLLAVLARLDCYVLVSGYECEMYNLALSSWRVVRYSVVTRGGTVRTESLWCNFPEPAQLHDYRYLGRDYRERERIRRMQGRWRARLSAMTVLERYALLSACQEHLVDRSAGESPGQSPTDRPQP